MNAPSRRPAAALLLAVITGSAAAQTTPFLHRTGSTVSTTVDVNLDSRRDLILLDPASGLLRTGLTDAAGAVAWTVRDTSVPGATGYAITPSINVNYPSLYLTSPAFNQVRVLAFDSTPDIIFSPPFAEPALLAPYAAASTGGTNGVLTASAGATAAPSYSANPAWASLWSLGPIPGIRQGNALSFTASSGLSPAFLKDAGGTATLHVQLGTTASAGTSVLLTGLPAASRWTTRLYLANATVFTWVPGTGSTLTIHPTANPGTGLYQFGTSASHTLPAPLDSIIPLETTAFSEFAAIHTDGTVRFYRFNPASPATAPTLLQSLPATGGPPQALFATGPTGFILLRRDAAGAESLTRYTWNGSSYTGNPLTTPPALTSRPLYSNVLFFQREPFVDPDPAEVHRQRVGDWTVSVSTVGQARQVNARTDEGPAAGLSAGTTGTIVSNPTGANFALPSQLDSASSLQLFSASTPGPLPGPQYAPAPGASPPSRPAKL